jgi:hypothetical protein
MGKKEGCEGVGMGSCTGVRNNRKNGYGIWVIFVKLGLWKSVKKYEVVRDFEMK